MHFRHSGIAVVLAALALPLAVAGCVVEQPRPVAEIVAPRRPPPPRVEVIPPAPRAAEFVVWRPGHWQWARGEFVWCPARGASGRVAPRAGSRGIGTSGRTAPGCGLPAIGANPRRP